MNKDYVNGYKDCYQNIRVSLTYYQDRLKHGIVNPLDIKEQDKVLLEAKQLIGSMNKHGIGTEEEKTIGIFYTQDHSPQGYGQEN